MNRELGTRRVRGGRRFQLAMDDLGTKRSGAAAEEAAAAGVLRNGNGESIDAAVKGFAGQIGRAHV